MKKTRIAALVLAGVLACTTAASAASGSAIRASASLYALGLMQGVAENADGTPVYALDRPLTREEAVVMALRAAGEEAAARDCGLTPAFADAAQRWSAPYIAYAAQRGMVNGVTPDSFRPTERVTRRQFAAMLLRVLGYREDAGDFTYDTAAEKAAALGIPATGALLTRGDAAEMLLASLELTRRGTTQTLAETLVTQGTISPSAAMYAGLLAGEPTAETIYRRSVGAVVLVRLYDREDNLLQNGSGFFLDGSGVLATNYHVIEHSDAARAEVVLHDGTVCAVRGVIDYDDKNDACLLRVEGSGFPFLTLETAPQNAGATVYAIGSPLGLQDSISVGVISNPDNLSEGTHYLLNTADISKGSSGGPLLNRDGKAVGVTTGAYIYGNSMYIAIHASYVAALRPEKPLTTLAAVAQRTAEKERLEKEKTSAES